MGMAAGAMAAWLTIGTLFGGIATPAVADREATIMAVQQGPTLDLASYRWENRLVLIFASTTNDATLQEQLHTFGWRDPEVVDRDLILGYFPITEIGSFGGEPIAASAGAALREKFDIAADSFTVLLIGKDGGVKMRSATPLTADKIFATIDSMPMRQQETR